MSTSFLSAADYQSLIYKWYNTLIRTHISVQIVTSSVDSRKTEVILKATLRWMHNILVKIMTCHNEEYNTKCKENSSHNNYKYPPPWKAHFIFSVSNIFHLDLSRWLQDFPIESNNKITSLILITSRKKYNSITIT